MSLDCLSDQLPTRHGQACPYQAWTGSGRVLCYKTFCQKIPDFFPDPGFFRIFFKSRCSLDHSVKLLLNKLCHILISLGGDRASIRYVVTEGRKDGNTQLRGFIY